MELWGGNRSNSINHNGTAQNIGVKRSSISWAIHRKLSSKFKYCNISILPLVPEKPVWGLAPSSSQ